MYRDNFIQILYEKNTTNNKKHNKPYMKKKKNTSVQEQIPTTPSRLSSPSF